MHVPDDVEGRVWVVDTLAEAFYIFVRVLVGVLIVLQ